MPPDASAGERPHPTCRADLFAWIWTLRWEGLPPRRSGGKPRCDVHPYLDKVDVLGMKLTFLLDKILYFCYNRIIKSRIGLLP